MEILETTTAVCAAVAMALAWSGDAQAQRPEAGPFEIEDERGNDVRLGLLMQATTGWERQGDEVSDVSSRWRRVRPKLSARMFERRLKMATQWSFTPGSVELLDAFVELEVAPWATLRAGQYKIPLTRYRMAPVADLTLIDWPRLTKYFGGERQLGVTAHSGWKGDGTWGYHVGVFTGVNARAAHGVAAPLLYDRARPNPSDLLAPAAPAASEQPEVVAHVSWSPLGGGETGGDLRLRLDASAALDFGARAGEDTRGRAALEASAELAGFTLTSVGYVAVLERTASAGRHDVGLVGALGEFSFHWEPITTLALRATMVEISDATRADVESDLTSRGSAAGVLRSERAYAAGIKLDLWGEALQLGLDAELVERQLAELERGLGARAQLQARF